MSSLKWLAIAAGALLLSVSTSVRAAPTDFDTGFVPDLYWGGIAPGYEDVVGGTNFDVQGGQISNNNGDLNVTIYTNYAQTVGANNEGALGTFIGSLFIGVNNTGPVFDIGGGGTNSGVPTYQNDKYLDPVSMTGDPGRFQFALVPTLQNASGSAGSVNNAAASLHRLVGDGSDVVLSHYPTPTTTSGPNFRNGQAVGYDGNADPETGVTATWSLDKTVVSLPGPDAGGTISFSIANFFDLSDFDSNPAKLTVAWAMTCANDVFMFTRDLVFEAPSEVPLPAGLVLLLSGLLGLGVFKRYQRKSTQAIA